MIDEREVKDFEWLLNNYLYELVLMDAATFALGGFAPDYDERGEK